MSNRFSSLASATRVAVLLLAGITVPATAVAMSLRELRTLDKSSKEGVNYANYYLVGAMEGVLEAHERGVRNGATPSICLKGRRLEPWMARSLFETELKRNEGLYEADMPAPLVMANALATAYTCAP
jgi:hypothetical protein